MREVLCNSLIVIMALILLLNVFTAISYATDNFDLDYYENNGADGTIKDPFQTGIGVVLSVIRIVGTAISFVIIMVVAIKYMSAAPGDRADIKKSSIQFVIGALILFGSTNILTLFEKVIGNMLK